MVEWIIKMEGDHVVTTSDAFQNGFKSHVVVRVFEIRHQEGNRTLAHRGIKMREGLGDVAAYALGLTIKDVSYNAQDVASSLAGSNELFNLVGKQNGSHLVVVPHSAES